MLPVLVRAMATSSMKSKQNSQNDQNIQEQPKSSLNIITQNSLPSYTTNNKVVQLNTYRKQKTKAETILRTGTKSDIVKGLVKEGDYETAIRVEELLSKDIKRVSQSGLIDKNGFTDQNKLFGLMEEMQSKTFQNKKFSQNGPINDYSLQKPTLGSNYNVNIPFKKDPLLEQVQKANPKNEVEERMKENELRETRKDIAKIQDSNEKIKKALEQKKEQPKEKQKEQENPSIAKRVTDWAKPKIQAGKKKAKSWLSQLLGLAGLQQFQFFQNALDNETVKKFIQAVMNKDWKGIFNSIGGNKWIQYILKGIFGVQTLKQLKTVWGGVKLAISGLKIAVQTLTAGMIAIKSYLGFGKKIAGKVWNFGKKLMTPEGRQELKDARTQRQFEKGLEKQQKQKKKEQRKKAKQIRKTKKTERKVLNKRIKRLNKLSDLKLKNKQMALNKSEAFDNLQKNREKLKQTKFYELKEKSQLRKQIKEDNKTIKKANRTEVKSAKKVAKQQTNLHKFDQKHNVSKEDKLRSQKVSDRKMKNKNDTKMKDIKKTSTPKQPKVKVSMKKLPGGLLTKALRFAKFIPGIGQALALQTQQYSAYTGWQNAQEILDMPEGKLTTTHKFQASIGQVLEDQTFGLISAGSSARVIVTQQKFMRLGIDGTNPEKFNSIEGVDSEIKNLQKKLNKAKNDKERKEILQEIEELNKRKEELEKEQVKTEKSVQEKEKKNKELQEAQKQQVKPPEGQRYHGDIHRVEVNQFNQTKPTHVGGLEVFSDGKTSKSNGF